MPLRFPELWSSISATCFRDGPTTYSDRPCIERSTGVVCVVTPCHCSLVQILTSTLSRYRVAYPLTDRPGMRTLIQGSTSGSACGTCTSRVLALLVVRNKSFFSHRSPFEFTHPRSCGIVYLWMLYTYRNVVEAITVSTILNQSRLSHGHPARLSKALLYSLRNPGLDSTGRCGCTSSETITWASLDKQSAFRRHQSSHRTN